MPEIVLALELQGSHNLVQKRCTNMIKIKCDQKNNSLQDFGMFLLK